MWSYAVRETSLREWRSSLSEREQMITAHKLNIKCIEITNRFFVCPRVNAAEDLIFGTFQSRYVLTDTYVILGYVWADSRTRHW
jgi:hypothetical protein